LGVTAYFCSVSFIYSKICGAYSGTNFNLSIGDISSVRKGKRRERREREERERDDRQENDW
jgi:hypothetical protein